MKFTDDEPDAQKGDGEVDRSQGAARAISVRPIRSVM
jgi:hypothetical protein